MRCGILASLQTLKVKEDDVHVAVFHEDGCTPQPDALSAGLVLLAAPLGRELCVSLLVDLELLTETTDGESESISEKYLRLFH